MNEKDFEKINIKIEISTWPSTSVQNFSQFEELQILGPNLSQNMNENFFEKINIKMQIGAWPYISGQIFSHFVELQVLGPNFLERI